MTQWSFDSTNEIMKWGSACFPIVTRMDNYEAAAIDAGCLMEVMSKYWKVFGELGKLPVADLPQIKITTEPGALAMQHP